MQEIMATEVLSLSSAQLEFWDAAKETVPPSARSFAAEYLEINGPISVAIFRKALEQVVQDSEALRSRFTDQTGDPTQVIYTIAPAWILPVFDFSGHSDPKGSAIAWMEASMEQARDLSSWPLFTFALFKISSVRFFWFQSFPHIMMDGFGLMLIARRTAKIYTALAKGQSPPTHSFAPLRELVKEDERYRFSEQSVTDRKRWQEYFSGHTKPITLAGQPLLRSRDNLQDLRKTVALSADETATLMAVVKTGMRVTPAQFIAAIAAAYIHRMSGESDIVLGFVFMVRLASKERRVPGMAANMLPLRLTVLPTMTIAELAKQAAVAMSRLKCLQRYRGGDLRDDLASLQNKQGVFGVEVNVMCFDYDLHFSGFPTMTHNIAAGTTDNIMINVSDRRDGRGLRIDFDGSPQYYTLDGLETHQLRFLKLLKGGVLRPDIMIRDLDLQSDDQPNKPAA